MYAGIGVCMCMHVNACECMSCMHADVYMLAYTRVCICRQACHHVGMIMRAETTVHAERKCMQAWLCMLHMAMPMHVYACICMYMLVYACVCMYISVCMTYGCQSGG